MFKFTSPQEPFFSFETVESSSIVPSVPHHYHNYYEFYYLASGSCHYFINNTVYDLTAGDVVIIPKGVIHKTAYDSPDYKRKLICCSSRFIPSSVINLLPSLPNVYRSGDSVGVIQEYIDKIEQEYLSELPFRDDALYGYFQLLVLTIVRGLSKSAPIPSADARISEILNYLKNNFRGPCELSTAASRFSLSPEHFSRLFKKETGLNFSEYRTMLRLREAERLLKSGSHRTVTEVASEAGFNDSNYFSQKFKEHYGVSPSRLRKNL